MKRNTKHIILTGVLCAAVAVSCGIGGLSAYFTDGDTKTNVFTVGKVSIDMEEPDYPGDDTPEVTDIVPGSEIKKDPRIRNDGINDAYVFMEVFVPYQIDLITANPDGTRNEPANKELFSYKVNDGWIPLEDSETVSDDAHMKSGYVRHLYAWGNAAKLSVLKGNSRTATQGSSTSSGNYTGSLFDSVKLINIIEDQGLEGSSPHIIINSYAIQTTALGETDSEEGSSASNTAQSPEAVWDILEKQAQDRVGHQGDSFFEHGTEDAQDRSSGESKPVSVWEDDSAAGK